MTTPKDEFVALISAFSRAIHSGRAHLAKARGFEPGHNFLLGKLKSQDLRSMDLATAGCVDASVVSRQVQSLVAAGLVERVADPKDGRAFLLHLTDAGREFHNQNHEIQVEFFDRVFANWSSADRAAFQSMLDTFVADLNREIQQLTTEPGGSRSS